MGKCIPAIKIAEIVKGEIKGNKDVVISSVATLKEANESDLSFLANKKYKNLVKDSQAGAIIVPEDYDDEIDAKKSFIFCKDPNIAFSIAIDLFAEDPVNYPQGIHPSSVVDERAIIGKDVYIGPNVVVEAFAEVGDNSIICAGSYIGHYVKIGSGTLIYPNVTIRERCIIGNKVIIHPGTVIGSDGYGYAPAPDGMGMIKLPQTGIVEIEDEVEIGANCTIDRARFGKTLIKFRTKVDNLVQIAHNAIVGEFCMLVGQCGLAGSAELGRGVVVGAQAGVNGHIKLGDGTKVAATSAAAKSSAPGVILAGTPAEPQREFMERYLLPKKVRKLQKKIKELENKIEKLGG